MTQQRHRSQHHASSHRRGKKKGRLRFLRWLKSIPLWGFVLGGAGIVAFYCFILFHFFVDPYSFQWKAIYGETTFPEGYKIRGIDISHYQENIDWEHLRNAQMNSDPVSFVFIKGTEGESILDENFNENFYQARQNDVIRGVYHFLTPDVPAKKQALFFLHQVHLEPGDLPPVLDVEDQKMWKAADKSQSDIQRMALEWLDIVEKHYNVIPIIYSSYKFRHDVLTDTIFNRYPFWMAHYYVDKPAQDIKWTFWQHTDCGKLSGIHGFVDCNIFKGSRKDLEDMLIKEDF